MENVNVENSIIFIAPIHSFEDNAVSTDLMTKNIIKGLKSNNEIIIFIAICNKNNCDLGMFKNICNKIITLPVEIGSSKNKYIYILKSYYYLMNSIKYFKNINKKIKFLGNPKIILSHLPCLDVFFYSKYIHKYFSKVLLYQYWSDPIALSGILPEEISIKRKLLIYIEKQIIKTADKVIYGTKTLLDFQSLLYKEYIYKMSYVDISYKEKEESINNYEKYSNRYLYAGKFSSNIRNIQPLLNAFSKLSNMYLDIYGTGDYEKAPSNVEFKGRVSSQEMENIEAKYKNLICILNKNCIQIPGKIFYSMNKIQNIIVITDGKYSEQISKYLLKYKRFILCPNDERYILKTIKSIRENNPMLLEESNYSPQKIAKDILLGGKIE